MKYKNALQKIWENFPHVEIYSNESSKTFSLSEISINFLYITRFFKLNWAAPTLQYIKDPCRDCPTLLFLQWALSCYVEYVSVSGGWSKAQSLVFSSQEKLILILSSGKKERFEWILAKSGVELLIYKVATRRVDHSCTEPHRS